MMKRSVLMRVFERNAVGKPTRLVAGLSLCCLLWAASGLAAEEPAAETEPAATAKTIESPAPDADAAEPAPQEPVPVAEQLATVPTYSEGVVFDHRGTGYVSAGDTIWQFGYDSKAKSWRTRKFAVTGAPNGHKILADGTHLVCDASRHAVLRLSAKGEPLPPAADQCEGKPLRGPNDLTIDVPNGGFYFTDPGGSDENNVIGTVHYVDRKGNVALVESDLAFPNGIVLTPNGRTLYVGESKRNRVLKFRVLAPGALGPRTVLADLPAKDESLGQIDNQPDGMCLDADGNLYVAHYGMRRVHVLSPEGKLMRSLPGGNLTTSNVAFGGRGMDQLFITGALEQGPDSLGGIFRIKLGVRGLVILPKAE